MPENGNDDTVELSLENKKIGRYEIIEQIGRGGMGKVYKSWDNKLDRIVAIKMIFGQIVDEKEKARFILEAKIIAKLTHPNIVAIYDFGFHNNLPYFVMEYVEGTTLKTLCKNSHLDFDQIAQIMAVLANTVHYAHTKKVIHRDLKPDNVIVKGKEYLKVLDFGLAKLEGEACLTKAGEVVGTIKYLPPEVFDGSKKADERADVYSLGVTLYEVLTGQPPFAGSKYQIMCQIVNDIPDLPSQKVKGIPKFFDDICMKALQKDKTKRYQSAREMAISFESYLNEIREKLDLVTLLYFQKWLKQINLKLIKAEYDGDLKDGMPTNKGKCRFYNDATRWSEYEGHWEKGLACGQGTEVWSSGDRYIGEYKDGRRNGQGTYIWADKSKYIGEFKNGKRDGHGTITLPHGDKYLGEFKNGKMEGQGTYVWANNEKNKGMRGHKYVGEWKNNKRHGQGTLYKDGSIVKEGHWEKGALVSKRVEKQIVEKITVEKNKEIEICRRKITKGKLNLSGSEVENGDLRILMGNVDLVELSLNQTNIDNEGLKYILESINLNRLFLDETKIDSQGLEYISKLKNLQKLSLNQTQITNEGLQYLSKLERLYDLSLKETDINNQGLEFLSKLTNIQWLYLNKTQIDDKGLCHLSKLKKLKLLCIPGTGISDEGEEELEEILPNCTIINL